MNDGFGRVILAPDSSGQRASLGAKSDDVLAIASRTLDGSNVEAEQVAIMPCARYVEGRVAGRARHAGSLAV